MTEPITQTLELNIDGQRGRQVVHIWRPEQPRGTLYCVHPLSGNGRAASMWASGNLAMSSVLALKSFAARVTNSVSARLSGAAARGSKAANRQRAK